jgi:hypothetical protein
MKRVGRTRFPHDFSKPFVEIFKTDVLPGLPPGEPPFVMSDQIMTLGSCFAEHIRIALHKRGVKCAHIYQVEDTNSPLGNKLLLEYALTDKPFTSAADEAAFPRDVSRQLRELIAASAGLIFTVGVAYCPFIGDELVCDFAVNSAAPGLTWRLTTYEENVAHISSIVKLLRDFRPDLTIVLTLSPIPLMNSFTMPSAVVADCVSKSVLRAALHTAMQSAPQGVHYWPGFEAIRWVGPHVGQIYGVGGQDQRHPGQEYVDAVVDTFIAAYFGAAPL